MGLRSVFSFAMALGTTATFAADWFAKDNLQPAS